MAVLYLLAGHDDELRAGNCCSKAPASSIR
jgi:hypothetical protein